MKKSVYLSPSMQEHNLGAGSYGTEEKRMNQIADILGAELLRHGLGIYRNNPEWTLSQAAADSNARNPNLHLAIHSNAGGGRGCEVYAYAAGGEGEKAARVIYEELEVITPTADRGVKFKPGFYELRATDAPAVLVEIAFHDNTEDVAWIISNIEPIAIALAKGVLRYFGINYIPQKIKPLQDSWRFYRVQVGAFSDQRKAEELRDRLLKAGFNGYVKYE